MFCILKSIGILNVVKQVLLKGIYLLSIVQVICRPEIKTLQTSSKCQLMFLHFYFQSFYLKLSAFVLKCTNINVSQYVSKLKNMP